MARAPMTARELLGSMFFGTAFSFILHGITSCQVVWLFRTQSVHGQSSKSMNALVVFVWLAEMLNCILMFCATMNAFLLPEITFASGPCGDWTVLFQNISSAMCTYTAEGFFIMRVWKLSEQKNPTMLAFIPYLSGFVFGVAQIVRNFQLRCSPVVVVFSPVFIFGSFCSRLVGDGVVAITMCYMLYSRSTGFMQSANTIKIVRGLILCSISTGLLTWITSILFLLAFLNVAPSGYTIYYMRGGIYVNAMLTQLNARTRFRAMAEATIPLDSINLSASETSLSAESQPVSRELQAMTI